MNENVIVTFCVVAYNASKSLGNLLNDLCKQTYEHERIEVVLVDSKSNDDTKRIMLEFAETHQLDFCRILVLDNEKRTLPCGWNVALKNYLGDVIVRVDAHAIIMPDFIEKNVEVILEGHDICGGKVTSFSAGESKWRKTLNAAELSMFGGGFARFRHSEKEGNVKTVAFGMYKREVFERVGEYNENLARTEDNEMHYRMSEAGYKFFYTPRIEVRRETRSSLRGLMKQKYGNGFWIGKTLKVCPKCFEIYHLIPAVFVCAVLVTNIMALMGIWQLAAAMWGAYMLFSIVSAALIVWEKKECNPLYLLIPVIFLLLHVSYGVGTIIGLVKSN